MVRVAYGSSLALALPSWNEPTSKSKKVDRQWEPVCRVRLERRGDESKRSHVTWSPSSATAKSGAILFLCVGDHWACELSRRSPLSRSGGAPFLDPTRWRGRGEADPLTRSQCFVSHWTRRDGDLLVGAKFWEPRNTIRREGEHMQSFSDNVVRVQSVPFSYSIHPLPIHWLSSP